MTRTAREILLQWIDHVGHLEMEEATGLYNEHATLLPTFSPHSLSGTAPIGEYFSQLATRRNLRVELHEGSLRETRIGGQTFVLTGVYSFHFDVDEDHLSFPSRFTFVLDTASDRPILHHHSSQVPRVLS